MHTDAIEEELEEIGERLERAERRVATFEREIAVLKRLQQALEAARSSAKETFLAPIAQELQPLLRILFDEASLNLMETVCFQIALSGPALRKPVLAKARIWITCREAPGNS